MTVPSQIAESNREVIEGRGVDVFVSLPLQRFLDLSLATSHGTAPDYVNDTDGRIRSTSLGLSLRGVQSFRASASLADEEFSSAFDGASYNFQSVLVSAGWHPSLQHHVSVFLNTACFGDRLDLTAPALPSERRARWQFSYTYEPARFSRLIVGASELGRGGHRGHASGESVGLLQVGIRAVGPARPSLVLCSRAGSAEQGRSRRASDGFQAVLHCWP